MNNKILSITLIVLCILCILSMVMMVPNFIQDDEVTEIPAKEQTTGQTGSGSDELGNGDNIVGTDGISIRTNGKDYTIADYITMKMEYAYHEGQKDFMEGDIRIDSSLNWIKSPWDGADINKILYKP